MANIKYADTSYTLITPTDDDQVMFRTGSGTDARAPLVQPKGYIDGLKMTWVSATQIQVSAGAAYVPGPKRIAELSAATTLTPSLAANTWYHLFLTVSGATVGVEAVTTAPAAAYYGTARAKTGDTSRRYIGSFLTDGSGAVWRFLHSDGGVQYLTNLVSPFRVLSGGTSTARTSVPLTGVVPPTTGVVFLNAINNGDQQLFIDLPEVGNTGAVSRYTCLANQRTPITTAAPSLALQYFYSVAPTGSGAFIDVWGYRYDR
ncbi:hypothetical protein QV000_07485 [Stenotrophomonas maltophilia]